MTASWEEEYRSFRRRDLSEKDYVHVWVDGVLPCRRPVTDSVMHRGGRSMAANHLVQARINPAVKEEAAAVLAAMGLTVSDAVRLLLTKVAHEKALPFAPLVPNAVTIEAMKEARRGGLPRFASVEDLLDDLHADD